MHTATLIVSLPTQYQLLVTKDDVVTTGTVLGKQSAATTEEVIKVGSLLGIANHDIPKHLKASIGSQIKKGDIIAKRKKLFTEFIVRSPVTGHLSSLDLTKGTIHIQGTEEKEQVIKSPIDGKVNKINEGQVEIEFSGLMIPAERGKGTATGMLSIYNSSDTLAGKIVATDPSEVLFSKFRALGACGVISRAPLNNSDPSLPFVIISPATMKQIAAYGGKKVVLSGDELYVVIIE